MEQLHKSGHQFTFVYNGYWYGADYDDKRTHMHVVCEGSLVPRPGELKPRFPRSGGVRLNDEIGHIGGAYLEFHTFTGFNGEVSEWIVKGFKP